MEHEQYDSATPHGHTAATGRREHRLLLRVTLRPGSTGMVMGDGRFHGVGHCQCPDAAAGVHEIQIYKSGLASVMALVETDEAAVEVATKLYVKRVAKWMTDNKQPEQAYGSSPQAVFRELNDRDILPFASIEVLSELQPIALAEKRMEGDATTHATRAGQVELAVLIAEAVATALAKHGIGSSGGGGNTNTQKPGGQR